MAGAGEAILVAQHAIDLLRGKAGKLLWRRPGTVKPQRRRFARPQLRGVKAAVGVFRFEHGENTRDTVPRQTKFVLRLVIVVIIIIAGNAEGQHLAHCGVGELIV